MTSLIVKGFHLSRCHNLYHDQPSYSVCTFLVYIRSIKGPAIIFHWRRYLSLHSDYMILHCLHVFEIKMAIRERHCMKKVDIFSAVFRQQFL